jgi:hypothetical protein
MTWHTVYIVYAYSSDEKGVSLNGFKIETRLVSGELRSVNVFMKHLTVAREADMISSDIETPLAFQFNVNIVFLYLRFLFSYNISRAIFKEDFMNI